MMSQHAATNYHTAMWYVVTKKIDSALCDALFAADNERFNPVGNLCMAYYHVGDAHFCRGDMGQPLSIRYNEQDILVGLNLHKHQCGHPREAASFVCVKSNKDWILKTMRN
ncbi:hypothetical protein ILUMI_19178 [Ignelater luminosus]|uniref:Peptidase S1 domain-containing protein n=1 Tax=Ignelater luminosus TaxID=2038154 RepID=A0A8K0G064_IGNLU|nr:hypothetical protein ILUMI_19178 [Ignelater luminosus]